MEGRDQTAASIVCFEYAVFVQRQAYTIGQTQPGQSMGLTDPLEQQLILASPQV